MSALVVGLLSVVVLVVAGVALMVLRNARDFADANEIVPGKPTSAPKSWAGAHSVEARLHRRLRDAMTALHANRALDEPALVDVRETLEREALAIDERLVAAAALPSRVRDEPLQQVATAVEAIEGVVADVVSLRGPALESTTRAIDDVRTRLALVEQARAELDGTAGTSSLEAIRRQLENDQARIEAAEPGPEPPADDER